MSNKVANGAYRKSAGGGERILCPVCNMQKNPHEMVPGEMVRPPIADLIKKDCPDWDQKDLICLGDLNHYRAEYVKTVLDSGKGEISELEAEVVQSLEEHELLTKNINAEFDRELTLGEKMADKVAEFGGSWNFIAIFGGILVVWILINSVVLLWRPFDPYPFILLNLVLSCLAAIQAPIIMMSQNRQEAKDRLRGEHDYRINLKAELEIRHINEKLDHLLSHQWLRLLEIQQIQTDIMEELMEKQKPS